MARSSVLHPPKHQPIVSAHIAGADNESQKSSRSPSINEEPTSQPLPAHFRASSDKENPNSALSPPPSVRPPSPPSLPSLPPTPSLQRSTSQRVLGFLSDLVRSTSSSVLNKSVRSDTGGPGNGLPESTKPAEKDVSTRQVEQEQNDSSIGGADQSLQSGSAHRSYESVQSLVSQEQEQEQEQ